MAHAHVRATYLIETPYALENAAAIMAGEQSTGTFVSVPGETDALKNTYGARVVAIKELELAGRLCLGKAAIMPRPIKSWHWPLRSLDGRINVSVLMGALKNGFNLFW